MTAEERVVDLVYRVVGAQGPPAELMPAIEEAIREAEEYGRREEREECLRILTQRAWKSLMRQAERAEREYRDACRAIRRKGEAT